MHVIFITLLKMLKVGKLTLKCS